jgi:hypothetical protein
MSIEGEKRSRSAWRSDLVACAVLALPFLVASWCLSGLHDPIHTFHWTDETDFHWPVILQFAQQWPWVNLSDYNSATTPLFHLLFAAFGKALGFDLPVLRAVNVLVSFLVGVVLFRSLVRDLSLDRLSAVLATLAFVLSPYFFGVSFILLTDNLAWLFGMLSLTTLLSIRMQPSWRSWGFGAACLSLALLTRQSFVWLLLVWGGVAAFGRSSLAERMGRLGLLALAALPLLCLFVLWQGPLPPSFQETHQSHQLLNPRAVGFSLAVLGLYAWPLLLSQVRPLAAPRWPLLVAVAVGLAWLWAAPLAPLPADDGFLWRVAGALPVWLGTSALFWCLVPSGVVAMALLAQQRHAQLALLALVAFGVTLLHSGVLFQKYLDPFIPLFLILSREPGRTQGLWLDRCVWAGMACFGVLYALLPYLRSAPAP